MCARLGGVPARCLAPGRRCPAARVARWRRHRHVASDRLAFLVFEFRQPLAEHRLLVVEA